MLRKISFLFLLSAVSGIPLTETDSLSNWDENNVDEVASMEDTLRELLEKLRKEMKEGIPEEGVPPMEPLRLSPMVFDFYIENTTLGGYLEDMVIRNLSDFEVKKLKVTLMPKKKLVADFAFPELTITGSHKLIGNLFGEIPINESGSNRIFIKNETVSANVIVRTKAGALQISDLKADFDIQRISVFLRNPKEGDRDREIPEKMVKDILDRFRSRYLPLLLNTGKIYLNDLLLRLKDSMDDNPSHPFWKIQSFFS